MGQLGTALPQPTSNRRPPLSHPGPQELSIGKVEEKKKEEEEKSQEAPLYSS